MQYACSDNIYNDVSRCCISLHLSPTLHSAHRYILLLFPTPDWKLRDKSSGLFGSWIAAKLKHCRNKTIEPRSYRDLRARLHAFALAAALGFAIKIPAPSPVSRLHAHMQSREGMREHCGRWRKKREKNWKLVTRNYSLDFAAERS